MWLKLIVVLSFQVWVGTKNCFTQNEKLQTMVIEYIVAENSSANGFTFLSQKTIGSLFGFKSTYRKNELSDILNSSSLDSLDRVCKNKAELFMWNNYNSNYIVLPEDSMEKLFSYNTEKMVRVVKCRLTKKNKEIVVKKPNLNNIYITTSPIIEYQNYLFIYVSSVRGITNGFSCLYVFENNNNQDIKLKRKAYCYLQ